jgi:DNA polymerase-3 subunit alpha
MKGSGILAGFSSTEQDELRRIIGKKDLKKLPKMKEKFVQRCIDNKVINEEHAKKIWDQFEKFGNYAFNKAHAVSYAKISYQNAFLKKYFPREFFAANMTRELRKASADDKDSNLKHYENEAKNYFGIELLEPCINKSKSFYTIEKIDGKFYLRKPFTYIAGIGDEAEKEIVAKQPYSSIEDFYIRQSSKVLNIKVMSGLMDNNCLSIFGEKEYLEKEILRCKEIKDSSSNKQKSIMKKMIPKMNGVL